MEKIKLSFQENQILTEREAGAIRGGEPGRVCGCACYYRYTGGSSIVDNREANYIHGWSSPNMFVKGASYKADLDDGTTQIW